jgi:hypothetical protein
MRSAGGGVGRSVGIGIVASNGGGSSGPIGGTLAGGRTIGGSRIIGHCQPVTMPSWQRAHRGPAQRLIAIRLSTLVTPGAAQAARSASWRSAQERTVPLRFTAPPSVSTAMRAASSSALPKLRFHVPFDVDVRSHVQPHGYGSEGWSVHSRHTAVLSMQRGTAELTAIKFLKFFL